MHSFKLRVYRPSRGDTMVGQASLSNFHEISSGPADFPDFRESSFFIIILVDGDMFEI